MASVGTSFPAPLRGEALLRDLSEEQRAIVESLEPRLFVEAAAGSGKTRVLAARAVYLIRREGVPPDQIRIFVFTRSAAAELRRRVASVLGGEVADAVDVTTFHAYGARLAFRNDPTLAEVASEDLEEAAFRSLFEGPLRDTRRGRPSIEELRARLVDHESGRLPLPAHAERSVRILRSRLGATGAVPRWDLLPLASQILEDRNVLAEEQRRHVFVDEAQDVTPREARLVAELAKGADGVVAVGDPRQAIMGFRGADATALDWISGERRPLAQSYRFGPRIAAALTRLDLPGCVVGRPDVEDRVDAFVGPPPWGPVAAASRAVLCRTNDECARVAAEFGPDYYVEADLDEPAGPRGIPVLTVHRAKSREWDEVAVIPWTDRDQEDVRVRYVAYSRARTRLLVGVAP